MIGHSASPLAPRAPVSEARLWFGFSAAAVAWAVAGLVGYSVVGRTCSWHPLSLAALVVPKAPLVSALLILAAFLVIATALAVSFTTWREVTREAGSATAVNEPVHYGRARFMAFGGMLMSSLFLLSIVLMGIMHLMVEPCRVVR